MNWDMLHIINPYQDGILDGWSSILAWPRPADLANSSEHILSDCLFCSFRDSAIYNAHISKNRRGSGKLSEIFSITVKKRNILEDL